MTEATMSRGSFLSGALMVVAVGTVWVLAKMSAIPGLGEVETNTNHPVEKHGLEDVAKVLVAMRILDAAFFSKWGPCLDGIWRIIVPDVSPTHDGIVVLAPQGPGVFRLKTAFVFRKRSKYGQNVMDSCFGKGAYA